MKQLLSGLMIILCLCTVFGSCKKNDATPSNDQVINITIKANESYSYSLGAFGDEEGASITTQAMHYQISSLSRQQDFSTIIYEYKPALNYTGTDEVALSSERGSAGLSPNNKITKPTSTIIRFTIVN